MRSDRTLEHITLDTGHTRRSPRSEVSDAALAALHDPLGRAIAGRGSRGAIPGCPGYHMTATAHEGLLIATAWAELGGQHFLAAPTAGKSAPLVTLGVAPTDDGASDLWRLLHDVAAPLATRGRACPQAPWLAVRFEPTFALAGAAAGWIGDWERCLAWAWISRVERTRTGART